MASTSVEEPYEESTVTRTPTVVTKMVTIMVPEVYYVDHDVMVPEVAEVV